MIENVFGRPSFGRRCLRRAAVAAVLASSFTQAIAGVDWSLTQGFSPTDRIAPVGGDVVVTNTLNQVLGTAGTIGYDEQISGSGTLTRVPPPSCTTPAGISVIQSGSNKLLVTASHTGVGSGSCVFQTKVSATAAGTFTTSFTNSQGNPVPVPTGNNFLFFERPKVSIATPASFDKGGSGTVTITLSNPNTTTARFNNTAMTVNLASGLVIGSGAPTNTCGGTLTANQGASTAQLGGAAQIPSSGSYDCTVSFPVTAAKAGGYSVTVAANNLTAKAFEEPSGPNSVNDFSPKVGAEGWVTVKDTQSSAYTSDRDRFAGDYDIEFFMKFNHLVSTPTVWSGGVSILFSGTLTDQEFGSDPFTGQLFFNPAAPDPNAWRTFPGGSFTLNVLCNGGAPTCNLFQGSVGDTGDISGEFYTSFVDPTAVPPNDATGVGKCTLSGGSFFVASDSEFGSGNVNCTFPAGVGSNTYTGSGTFIARRPKGFVPGTTTTQPTTQPRVPPTGFRQVALPSQSFLFLDEGTIPAGDIDVYEAGDKQKRSLVVDLKIEEAPAVNNRFASSGFNAYVVALVPGGQAQTVATYTAYAKPPSGAWAALSGPIPAFLQNVAVSSQDQRVRLEIIRDTDVNNLIGTEFYVGYGTSDSEMIQAKRYRGIYYIGF